MLLCVPRISQFGEDSTRSRKKSSLRRAAETALCRPSPRKVFAHVTEHPYPANREVDSNDEQIPHDARKANVFPWGQQAQSIHRTTNKGKHEHAATHHPQRRCSEGLSGRNYADTYKR